MRKLSGKQSCSVLHNTSSVLSKPILKKEPLPISIERIHVYRLALKLGESSTRPTDAIWYQHGPDTALTILILTWITIIR